jgi:hypothetical protein
MSMNGPDASADDGPRIGPGGRVLRAGIPAQAQVAAWAPGAGEAEPAGPNPNGPARGSATVCSLGRSTARGKRVLVGPSGQIDKGNEFSFYFFSEAIFI